MAIGLLGWVQPNALGTVFLYAQGLATGIVAALEAAGWRASPSSQGGWRSARAA